MGVIKDQDLYVCDNCGKQDAVSNKVLPMGWHIITLSSSVITSKERKIEDSKTTYYCGKVCHDNVFVKLKTFDEAKLQEPSAYRGGRKA